jgi:PAS domain S-box-containing protein
MFSQGSNAKLFDDLARKLIAEGEWKGQIRQYQKDGQELVIQSSMHLLKDERGHLQGLVMVNRDLTDFLRIEKEAYENRKMLELIFDNIPGFIFWVDHSLRFLGYNANFSKLFGEIGPIPQVISEMHLAPEHLHAIEANLYQVMRSGKEVYRVNNQILFQGRNVWIESDYIPIKGLSGEVIGVLCTMHDVTERTLFQQQLQENEANLTSIIENADNSVCYMDKNFGLKAYNTPFSQMHEQYFGAVLSVGQLYLETLPKDWKLPLEEIFNYVLLGRKLIAEREMSVNGEDQWFEFSCNPVVSGEQIIGLCFAARNIAQRKLNEKLLLNAQLQQEKVRSLAMIQGQEDERSRISMEMHDGVGQILTALQLQSNYLQEKDFDSVEAMKQRLQKLDQLIKTAKQEVRRISFNLMPSMLKDFGLAESVDHLCKVIFDATDIALQTEIRLSQGRFSNELEVGIFRILQEIFNNILKHSEATRVNFLLISDAHSIYLSVTDNGNGFDAQRKLEDKKFGNGLNNIKHRVSLLGGSMNLKAQPGQGCAYSIIFPCNPATSGST